MSRNLRARLAFHLRALNQSIFSDGSVLKKKQTLPNSCQKEFLNRNSNQLGFALPLVLMMMGVTILLMIAVFNLNLIAVNIVEKSYLQSQFRTLISQVNSILKNESSCSAAMTGDPQLFNTAIGSQSPFHIYFPQANTNLFLISAGSAAPLAGMPTPLPSTYGDLQVTQMALQNLQNTNTNSYEAKIILAAQPASSATSGKNRYYSDELKISLVVDGSNFITSCSSLVFGNSSNYAPIPACSPLQFFMSDGTQVQCKQMVCPPDQTRIGFNPDGSVQCNPTPTPT